MLMSFKNTHNRIFNFPTPAVGSVELDS